MRPCGFHSRKVANCVPTSTRLWTCIRSIRFARRSDIERSIDLIPFSLPRVQTFVARKTLSRMPSAAVTSPITSSARPYIGDVSITRPPSFTKSDRTSPSCLRLSAVGSTSNACQVPKPITGSFSPDEGIARVSIVDDSVFACTRDAGSVKHTPAALAPIRRVASRRVIRVVLSLVMSSKVETSLISNDNGKRFLDFARNDKKVTAQMKTTRRHFIKLSGTAAGAFALHVRSTTMFAEESVKPLRILILGGTGFTGPYQVRYALSRGHKVTTFNRGKTHPGELPAKVEQLIGDRNGDLDALKNRQWDVVIDNPTTLPAWVRDAAQVLKGNVDRYVFISTISVYGEPKQGPDENTPTEKYEGPDPYKETIEAVRASGFRTYGPLKALSEREAEKWFPGKTLIIRPGLIVGPRDESDRFA